MKKKKKKKFIPLREGVCAYQPINTRQWRRGVSLDNNFLRPFYSTMSRVSRGYYYYVLRILHTRLTQADSYYPLYNFFFLYLILIVVQTTLITQLLATSTNIKNDLYTMGVDNIFICIGIR